MKSRLKTLKIKNIPIFSGLSSIWDQAFHPKTYVDGYGVTREEYVSPIAQALRKAEKLLNEPKTITLEDGTESHIITGELPAVNNAKFTTKWWNNPELRTILEIEIQRNYKKLIKDIQIYLIYMNILLEKKVYLMLNKNLKALNKLKRMAWK